MDKTEPRSLEEWATYCSAAGHWTGLWTRGAAGGRNLLCLNCAHAYAEQRTSHLRVETARLIQQWQVDQGELRRLRDYLTVFFMAR